MNIIGFTIVAALCAMLPLTAAEPPDPARLAAAVDRAWYADVEAWADYAFRRDVTRRSIDGEGKVKSTQTLLFELTPKGDGFDEKLLEIDGKPASPRQVKDHRGRGTFTKHYKQAADMELYNPIGEDLALKAIVTEQQHRYVEEEVVDGTPCYRTRFEARPEPGKGSVRERLKYAIQGSACVSVDGYHVVDFEFESVRSLKEGPVRLEYITMTIRGQAVENDGWAPEKVELESKSVVFGKRIHKRNTWVYSAFRHRPAP